MSLRALSKTLLAILLVQLASGCSLAFMTRAPEPVAVPNYPVDCTSSNVAPVLDSICAGYFVVNGLVLAGYKTCDSASFGEPCVSSSTKTGGILLSAGLATLCAISAGSGVGVASKCGEVKTLNALCITGNEAACHRLNPTWTPPLNFPATPPPQGAAGQGAGSPMAAPAAAEAGCTKDMDCKGNRICERGLCVEALQNPTSTPKP